MSRERRVKVLGVDPGTHRTGWGVVESHGSRFLHVASGTIAGSEAPLPERLRTIGDILDQILGDHDPRAVAVETVFHARNARSALLLGHARGVALLCAARHGADVFEYTAGQIKQALTGRGRADKQQVQQMVRLVLGLDGTMGLDTSDALAAAICHLQVADSLLTRVIGPEALRPVRSRRKAVGLGARGGKP